MAEILYNKCQKEGKYSLRNDKNIKKRKKIRKILKALYKKDLICKEKMKDYKKWINTTKINNKKKAKKINLYW